jgi:ornithine cyclodeaminase/alanine dehydrogenase-like protein (mu-crystallin family)
LACKVVSFFPDNALKGLHTHSSTVLLFDESTGFIKAVCDI